MKQRRWLWWAATATAVLLLLAALFGIGRFEVASSSMEPTYSKGDQLIVDRLVFYWRSPRRWEVVVFRGPEGVPYLKRVVGLPGESVQVIGGDVYINGEAVRKPDELQWLHYQAAGAHGIDAIWRLDANEFFLLGDNSPDSDDSRNWQESGVPRSALIGRPIWKKASGDSANKS